MSTQQIAHGDKKIKTQLAIGFSLGVFLVSTVALGDLAAEDAARGNINKLFSSIQEHPVKARIIQKDEWVQPGRLTKIGIYFELQPGWHIYAEDPGDAGMPTQVEWNVPKSVSLGQSEWPKPHEFEDAGDIRTFGYEDDVVFTQKLALKQIQFDLPSIPIRAEAQWLACKNICIPGSAVLEASLAVNTLEVPKLSDDAKLFEKYGAK